MLKHAEDTLLAHQYLPQLVRERAPAAAEAALALGGWVLLMPQMEGYFQSLREIILENPFDMKPEPPPAQSSDDGGTSYSDFDWDSDSTDKDLDWGDNSDFLDGDFGVDGDSVGSDGCGVEGGDGGCGGDGCGGCCGD